MTKTKIKQRKRRDLSDIDGLDKFNDYAPNNDPPVTGDDLILQQLFDSTGVHSALKHDVIMEQSNQETLIVEQEANRVANEAILALKVSRQQIRYEQKRNGGEGVPTWTGKSGTAGSFSNAGPSSTSILAKLRERNAANSSSGQGVVLIQPSQSDLFDISSQTSKDNLISKIQAYFLTKPLFKTTTSDIIEHFKVKIKPTEVNLFRKMLKGIAKFDKDEFGNGSWVLSQEFR